MKKQARRSLLHLAPLLLSLLIYLPLLFLAGGSLMSSLELTDYLGPVVQGSGGYARWQLLPQYPTARSYVELLMDSPAFFIMFWNSVKLAVGSLLGQLVVAIPAAWWFARSKQRRSRWLFTVYVTLMLMPFQVTMVSNYIVLNKTGLLDTHWSILLPAVFSTFPIFIIYRFFRAIPQGVIEAAQIDGANDFQIFWHIGIPMGRAGIASALVLGFLEYWNLIQQPMTFLKTQSLWPLSLFLPRITADGIGLALAASVVTLLPSILVFLYGQSYLERGITAAGIKE